jgi:hypothetical protein
LICYRLAAGSTFISAESQWTDTQIQRTATLISLQGCKQTKEKKNEKKRKGSSCSQPTSGSYRDPEQMLKRKMLEWA